MIKSIVVHGIPIDTVPTMERWYHRDDSAEIARRYGPWLARHATWDTYPFVKPFEGLVSSFLLEQPNDEFLRDLRSCTP